MLTMNEAKASGLAAAGQEFETPKGVVGRILPERSERGKLQAELSCATPGCTNTHIREVSDWHQCAYCRGCKKPSGSGAGGSAKVAVVGGGRTIKLEDGTVLREMKLSETDDADLKALKAENNRLFEGLWAQRQAERDAAKQGEIKKAAIAQARKAIEVARSMGVAVSPTLLKVAGLDQIEAE